MVARAPRHRLDPAIRTQEVQTFRRKLRRWSLEMGWIMHVRALKIHIRISRRSQLITDTTRASEKWLVVHDTKLLKLNCKFCNLRAIKDEMLNMSHQQLIELALSSCW